MTLTVNDLISLRPLGADLFRPVVATDPDAFDIYWELVKALRHPLQRLEVWGWLVEARRQNRSAASAA